MNVGGSAPGAAYSTLARATSWSSAAHQPSVKPHRGVLVAAGGVGVLHARV